MNFWNTFLLCVCGAYSGATPPMLFPTHPLAEVEAGNYDGVSVYCEKSLAGKHRPERLGPAGLA